MEMYGALVSELYQGRVSSVRINSEIANTTQSVDLGVTSGLTSIAHGSNVALIYLSLSALSLTINDTSYQTTWTPTTEELAPFPSLVTLRVYGGFPFTDDLLFRGNGTTLQNLRIPFSALVRDGLGRFGILKRSGVTLMNRVRIGACTSTDKEYIAGREDLPIRQQVHRILQTATVMAIDSDAPGLLIFDAICEAPNTAIIQHLELGRLWCAADDIIKLLVALPSLVNLCCSVSKLESEIEAIPASERPSRLCAKYHPLSNSFRVLQVRSYSDLSGELVACTAMLVAVLCPNFVQVDLPLELRKAFGREIAWALVNDTFKPYADSINRLIYKESSY
ncbi:hypothetical protein IWW47_000293 [Coemansia sp. RSA 2052]|nr:hypothetical protein IWW47_000293 [Coemansia sp. RSA 2052]